MRSAGRWAWLGHLAAAGFVVSSISYAATALGLVGPAEPEFGGDVASYLTAYLDYRGDGFVFEQVANWCLAVALVALGLLAVVLHQVAGFADLLSSGLAAVLLLAGSLLAAATQIWYLGTLAPVLDARSIPGVDHGALATMTESARRADDYLENLGLLLIAAGLLCLTRLASARSGWPRDWQALSAALAVGVLVVVATSFAGSDLNDWALLAVGLVLAPLWAARLGLLLSRRVPPEPA